MKRSKAVEVQFRLRLLDPGPIFSVLEKTEDKVWFTASVLCDKYTLRGVPAKQVDVLVQGDLLTGHFKDAIVLEVSKKTGKFDGAVRDRLTLRRFPHHQVDDIQHDVEVSLSSSSLTLRCGPWTKTFERLRSNLEGYELSRIVMWHWRRYFTHLLDGDTIRQMADIWAIEVAQQATTWTLAEANRSASRALYRFSRENGFRKLDTCQVKRLKAPSMWVTDEWYQQAMLTHAGESPTGAGQATLRCEWE